MSYKSIIESRGLLELPYQKDFLTNSNYKNCTKPLVLAAGTSSGKTFMSIMDLELFYSKSENKNKRTLFLPASKTILRDNVAGEIKWFNPSFTYCVATNKKELLQAIKNKCQVIIALPQTINSNYHYLPKFHNFILDEAHQWYFKDTVQKIVKQIKPTRQLLLTGTPSRFIAKGGQFEFKFVPVMELFDLKQVTNVKLEVVSSSYDFKQSDYVSSYGNLKSNVKMSDKESETALMGVCKEMIKKLKNPIKGLHNVNRLSKNLFSIFGELDKTIIFCHSLNQADAFYNSLDSFKGLKGKVLISHSENDKDSVLFEQFKNDSDIKVLVAVDRGRLGYNMPELFNVVDFTMTQSLDMLLQMYGRLLRLSKTDKQKIYYKVSTKNTAPYFVDLMTAMLCLTDMEWYSKYNGKNMGGILIPRVLSNTKVKSTMTCKSKSKTTKPAVSLEQLGIPLDLNLFNESILHTNGDKFSTIAWNTLDDARREFFNIKEYNYYSIEDVKKIALKYKLKKDFYTNDLSVYNAALKYNILDECCKHMDGNYAWNFDLALNESKKYKKVSELKKYNNKLWNAIVKYNWLNKLSLIDDRAKHWKDVDIIHKEALKYKTRGEFSKANQSAYNAAKRLNIIDKICSHMIEVKVKKRTKSMCIAEAKKHIRKRDFSLSNPSLYNFACKMGWIDECCKHMVSYAESWKIGKNK
jgi:superfamily II DNA or RNA helicase